MIMARQVPNDRQARPHPLRVQRIRRGWTQAQLAQRAGISRTAVTAIEGERLVPSVTAALVLAKALDCTVENLFDHSIDSPDAGVWASEPPATMANSSPVRWWEAEIGGRILRYPAHSAPMLTPLHDQCSESGFPADQTLVIACCDPAAGLLASQFAAVTGFRLLVLSHSSRQAIDLLHKGLVHLAGLHLSTDEEPDGNDAVVREVLGVGYQMVRLARWQEGVVSLPTRKLRTIAQATRSKTKWVGRESGSGARQCLEQLLGSNVSPALVARHHRSVVEAIQSGWAEAGICPQLVSAEAGLNFLSVREEAYDVCFSAALAEDRRIKAFIEFIRSSRYRTMVGELPGYNTVETGQVWEVN